MDISAARAIAQACRIAVRDGIDPKTVIGGEKQDKTFRDAAEAIIERRKPIWKAGKTEFRWRMALHERCASLSDMPVHQITVSDIERVLRPLWYSQNHTARMTRGMIEQALDLATVLEWRSGDNPARWKGALEYLLPDHKPSVVHHAAMPHRDAPAFFGRLMASGLDTSSALALTILTASRGHMVRHAVWSEFDLDKALWTIPAGRMKRSAADHVVPLTPQMLALLPAPGKGLVFPYRGKGFSENAFASCMKALGVRQYTAHGFRSTFKDWAMDVAGFPDEVSEMALAHKSGNAVRRAYRRGIGLERRRELLTLWSDYLHP